MSNCSKQCYGPEIFDVALRQSEKQPYYTWYLRLSVPALKIIQLIRKIETDAFAKSKFEMRSKLYTEPENRCVECVISGAPFPEHHCHCP